MLRYLDAQKGSGIILLFCSILVFSLTANPVFAQSRGSVHGIVTDTEDGASLPGAHVYLGNTTIGDITDPNGYFSIDDIQPGMYKLIVTMIGYKPHQETVEILPDKPLDLALKMGRDVYQVGEITVTDEKPKSWKKDLNRFERMFLGITDFRRGCEIENPFILTFGYPTDRFTASASEPITIINKALGYKVTYHLSEFTADGTNFRFSGQPVFEELEPQSDREAKRWAKRREAAYEGSFQHFLRSLAAGTSHEEGFRLYLLDELYWKSPHRELMTYYLEQSAEVSPASILGDNPHEHERSLSFYGFLHIVYLNEMMDRTFYEWVEMPYNASKEPGRSVVRIIHTEAYFNEIGFLNNAFDVARYGYWNWESGICNWLPFNYGL